MTSLIDIESAADDAFDYVGEMLFARLNKPPELSRCWRRSKPAGVTDIAWDEQLHRLLSRLYKGIGLPSSSCSDTAFVLFRAQGVACFECPASASAPKPRR